MENMQINQWQSTFKGYNTHFHRENIDLLESPCDILPFHGKLLKGKSIKSGANTCQKVVTFASIDDLTHCERV